MRQRKDGEKIIVGGDQATVHLRPASGSGMQLITFDNARTVLGWELRDWKFLAQCESVAEGQGVADATNPKTED